MGKTPEEIAEIWLQYHSDASQGRAGSVLSKAEWEILRDRASKSPMFVLPVAKPGGAYITLLTQHQLPFTLVTSLDAYRRWATQDPPAWGGTLLCAP